MHPGCELDSADSTSKSKSGGIFLAASFILGKAPNYLFKGRWVVHNISNLRPAYDFTWVAFTIGWLCLRLSTIWLYLATKLQNCKMGKQTEFTLPGQKEGGLYLIIFIITSGKSYQILLSIFCNINIVTIERRIQMLKNVLCCNCKMTNTQIFSWILYSNRMRAKFLKRNKPHGCIYIFPCFYEIWKNLDVPTSLVNLSVLCIIKKTWIQAELLYCH